MESISYSIPASAQPAYDVIVVGGGPSGSMAAIAAAREGARVLLIEQYGFLGGSLTAMGVSPMMSFHNRAGKQLVRGQPQELIDRLIRRGASPGHIPDSTGYCSTVNPFDSEALKIELETMAVEAGVTLLYHTMLVDVIRQDDRLVSVVVANKGGLSQYAAQVFIDSTGDADLAARAGIPFSFGREKDGAAQPMTMNFKVGQVDTDRLRAYIMERPETFPHMRVEILQNTPRISLGGFLIEWEQAIEAGEITVPREYVLMFETATPGVIVVNTSRVGYLDATNPFDLSRAELIGRQQANQIFRFLKKHCRGFEDSILLATPVQVGVRESRHIQGVYTLSGQDVIEATCFPDPIAVAGYPIDIHNPTPNTKRATHTTHLDPNIEYQIPMQALLTAEVKNLIVACRGLSATHEALAAVRVTPIMMAVGQAAGLMGAAAGEFDTPPRDLPYDVVRPILDQRGVYLGRD
jgi:hypothetical protein